MKGRLRKIPRIIRSIFTFTPAQVRGILILLPLLAVVVIVIATANRPRFERSFLELAVQAEKGGAPVWASKESGDRVPPGSDTVAPDQRHDTVPALPEPFVFDPNTVMLQELCRLGFSTRTAAGIVKYRESGKRFEVPADFAICYGVSLEDYTRLEPYIRIAEEFRPKRSRGWETEARAGKDAVKPEPFDPDALDKDGFVALGFSPAQADVIVRYRHSIGGFGSMDDLRKCYVVSSAMADRLAPYAVFPQDRLPSEDRPDTSAVDGGATAPQTQLLEINSADSAALRSVSGIGEVLVVRIMEYRDRLGGFVDPAQLSEVKGMYEENFLRICEQIRVDSCRIQKIDVNFAPHKTLVEQMGKHPYATDGMLRKLLKNRQLKGGWNTIGDMIDENIMTEVQAGRFSPYLLFRSE